MSGGVVSLERRIDQLEARAEIEALAHLYCRAMDEQDPVLLETLFTPESRVISDNGWMDGEGGRDGVVRMYRNFWTTLGATFHWMHGVQIVFDENDPDAATGMVMGHAETYRDPKTATYLIAMRYEDRYRRDAGRWKYAERNVSMLYFCLPGEYNDILGSALRMTVRGKGEMADWPENKPGWKTFGQWPGTLA